MRLPLIAAALVLVAAPAYAQHGSHGTKTHYQAPLRGASQVPPVATNGSGVADVWYDTASKTLSWKITYSGLTGPVTAAHIHRGAAGVNGPPVVTLSIPGDDDSDDCDVVADALLDEIVDNPAGFYVNVHTADYPNGAIRGQLMRVPGA